MSDRPEKFKPEGQLKVGGNQFEGSSNYHQDYPKKEGTRAERARLPQNEIMPKGNFENHSTYSQAYLETHPEPNKQIRPEGELKVGGNHFQGSSSYNQEF